MIPGGGDLRFDRMPPLWVPLRAFLVAPFLGAAGGLVLAIAGEAAFASRWSETLVAALHLVTIGFITLVMVGAIFQVLPVVTGVPVPASRWVAPASQVGITGGAIAMAWGILGEVGSVVGIGAVLLGGGLGIFAVGAIIGAWRTRQNPTGRAMGLSVLSLGAVTVLGVLLLAGHIGWISVPHDLTDIHLAWALAGWVGLLVIGVSFQVVPMFQVTPPYPAVIQVSLPALAFAALVTWTIGRLWEWPLIADIGIVTVAVTLGGYAVVTLWLQSQRRRKLRDVTTDAWRLGMASLVVAAIFVIAAVAKLVDLSQPRLALTFGVLVVVGFAVSVIEGMLYKIVPFLSWLHLQNIVSRAGGTQGAQFRNMRQLLPVAGPRRQFVTHIVALTLLLVAAWFAGPWVRLAGLALAIDLGWLGLELVGVTRRYREDRDKIRTATT